MTRRAHPNRLHGGLTPATVTLQAGRDANGNPVPVSGRGFSLTGYTGGRMRPRYWGDDVVVDLAGVQIPADQTVPVILDHAPYPDYVIGSTSRIRVADGSLTAEGQVTAVGAPAIEAIDLADQGHTLQCSIGCDELVTAYVEAGTTITVNGQQFTGPLIVVQKSTLREISVTVLGADRQTSFEIQPPSGGGDVAASGGTLPLQSTSTPPGSPTVSQPTTPPAVPPTPVPAAPVLAAAATPPTANTSLSIAEQMRLEATAEATRIAAVNRLHATYGSQPGVDRTVLDQIQARAIGENWNVQQTELELLRAARPTSAPSARGHAAAVIEARALECAMMIRCGVATRLLEPEFGAEVLNRASDRHVRAAASFSGLFNQVLAAAGQPGFYGAMNNDSIRATFEADRTLRASGGAVSTYSLSGILSNVANKALMAAFLSVDSNALRPFGRDSSNNFKQVSRYRMTAMGDFEEVAKDGEIKDLSLSDDTFNNQIKTFAGKLGISRQDLINDDLGAFNQIGQHVGRKAAVRIHKSAYETLLSNPGGNFFVAGNGNLLTGAGSAFGIAGLTSAYELFMLLKDKAGHPVMIQPKFVVTAPANHVLAKQIYNDVTVNETTTANTPKPNSNPHRGMFEPIVSPWLATGSGLTNALNARWFLLADPADVPCVSLIFLNGVETPVIESSDLDFDTLGVGFRGYLDFGSALADPKGGVQANGS